MYEGFPLSYDIIYQLCIELLESNVMCDDYHLSLGSTPSPYRIYLKEMKYKKARDKWFQKDIDFKKFILPS